MYLTVTDMFIYCRGCYMCYTPQCRYELSLAIAHFPSLDL